MDINLVVSVALATLLLYSSIAKTLSYQDFKTTIQQLKFPLYFTWLVVAVEGIIAVLLVLDFTQQIGHFAAMLLFLSFYVVAGLAIYKKLNISCNCFGKSSEEKLGWGTIWKVTPLLLLALIGLSVDRSLALTSMNLTEMISCVGLTVGILNMYFMLKNRKLLLEGGS
ncbi:Methylamine utilisation protein MauE [Paenibacillus uliginis N3/975]|uniref:Methylamine utilisation protein MauE n=1 Tax=Paenibacillus uliginis N3/975 TaxID=1313296 RepID=A0A1X7HSJ0_9BACL|nr:MauE/DoxX family redox-associated membrane protein [Paenibacillus uliginis]SMF92191.1 Methylamine utilisation protein MauE [Paenibacillus uliginis N3/975]